MSDLTTDEQIDLTMARLSTCIQTIDDQLQMVRGCYEDLAYLQSGGYEKWRETRQKTGRTA